MAGPQAISERSIWSGSAELESINNPLVYASKMTLTGRRSSFHEVKEVQQVLSVDDCQVAVGSGIRNMIDQDLVGGLLIMECLMFNVLMFVCCFFSI